MTTGAGPQGHDRPVDSEGGQVMDVILTQSVDNLGEMGAIVSVAPGYARNYLIPKGMAVIATKGQRKQVDEKIRLEQKRDARRKADAEVLARQWAEKELSVTITVQAGEDDKLFGSVVARDIAQAFSEQSLSFEHQQILLEEPIKQLGVYTVPVQLHRDVEVAAKVWVVKG